jgi:hypothetical protein
MRTLIPEFLVQRLIAAILVLLITAGGVEAALLFESQERYVDALAVAGPNQDHQFFSASGFDPFDATADARATGVQSPSPARSRAIASQQSSIALGDFSASARTIIVECRAGSPGPEREPASASFNNLFNIVFSVTDTPQDFSLWISCRMYMVSLTNLDTEQSIVSFWEGDFGPETITLDPGRYELYAADEFSCVAPPDLLFGEYDLYYLDLHAIPEPGSIVLLGLGAMGLLACGWRRMK